MKSISNKAIKYCLSNGCSEVEVSIQKGVSARVGLEMKKAFRERIQHMFVSIRVLRDGKLGSVNTSYITPDSLKPICDIAIKAAQANPNLYDLPFISPAESLPTTDGLTSKNEYLINDYEAWIQSESSAVCSTFNCQLLSLIFSSEMWDFILCNSKGACGSYRTSISNLVGVAKIANPVNARPVFFMCHGLLPDSSIVDNLNKQGLAKRLMYSTINSIKELNGKTRFSADASSQLVSALAQCFNGNNILLNNSFLAKDLLGKQLWNTSISIIDDPNAIGGMIHLPFDAEGILAKKKYLIHKGVFTSILCDIPTQHYLGFGSPGNARRVPPHQDLRISPSNLILEICGPLTDDHDVFIDDLGIQSTLDPSSGILRGLAAGHQNSIMGSTPTMFRLNLDINHLFAAALPATASLWTGPIYAPEFVATI